MQLSWQDGIIDRVKISTREPGNTSTHDPVIATVCASLGSKEPTHDIPSPESNIKRTNWRTIDKDAYTEFTEEGLRRILEESEKMPDPEVMIDKLNECLWEAGQSAQTVMPHKSRPKKTRKGLWHPGLRPYITESKNAHWRWKKEGCPTIDSPLWRAKKEAGRRLRRQQRKLQAVQREKEYTNLMQASTDNQTLFFSLIRKQRKTRPITPPEMEFNGKIVPPNELPQAWAQYFKDLATPKDSERFDEQHRQSIETMYNCIRHYEQRQEDYHTPLKVPTSEVRKAISTLKNGKSCDIYGIASEHLKSAHSLLPEVLTAIFNSALQNRTFPKNLATGLITPVYKKKGSAATPDNYRKITVTPIIGKVLEKLLTNLIKDPIRQIQSPLQRGFTEGTSAVNTSLLITEAVAEAKLMKKPLYIAMLDASKAFDVVWHQSMLTKLYQAGVTGPLWQMFSTQYEVLTSCVKWNGTVSQPLPEKQGVRQGGIASTEFFKVKLNNLLLHTENSNLGFKIGTIDVSIPTCADDVTEVTDHEDNLQVMMSLAEDDGRRDRYHYGIPKTNILVHSAPKHHLHRVWKLDGEDVDRVSEAKHLGVHRNTAGTTVDTIQESLKKGRRATFSMMGTGFYGYNGIHLEAMLKMWNMYIVPRMLYGLEALLMQDSDIERLEVYQRSVLRSIQHLSPGTANASLYLLTGAQPIEMNLDRRTLTLMGRILNSPTSREHQIIQRQLLTKDLTQRTWATRVRCLLIKYDLPGIFSLLNHPIPLPTWKKMVKQATTNYWNAKLKTEASRKPTLRYLNTDQCTIGKLHTVWEWTHRHPEDIKRAAVKLKLLTGTYQLQAVAAKHTGATTTCQLCGQDAEDLAHFLLRCRALESVRVTHLRKILAEAGITEDQYARTSEEDIIQLLLDATSQKLRSQIKTIKMAALERATKLYTYALHLKRAGLLNLKQC